jgi:hypothetical protein
MKANDLIASSLRLIGVLASGETPSAAEAADGLMILNDMVDLWQTERLMIFTTGRQVFHLTAGVQAYTMGLPGGTFAVPRPTRIEAAGIINLANPAQPLELPMEMLTLDQWAAIPVKNIASALPLKVYDDGGFPLRVLSYWCIPNLAVDTALYTWSALSQFADLVTDYPFPPGYAKALRYNLAVDLAPEYGRSVTPEVAIQAVASQAIIKSLNTPVADLRCDPALVSPNKRIFNWLTGEGVRRG